MPASLAVLIPAYQAGGTVGDVVARSLVIVPRVLVVDDGSTDETSDAARDAGADVLRLERNSGKGTALRTGFRELLGSGVDAVLTLDADGQHLPEELPALAARAAGGADLVLGSREHLFAEMCGLRRASNRLSSRAISLFAGVPLTDVQTGFRLYTRRLLERVGFPGRRFEAESAVVVRAARAGLTIETVPVRLGRPDGRSTSHYRPLVDSLRIAGAVVRARLARPEAMTCRSS